MIFATESDANKIFMKPKTMKLNKNVCYSTKANGTEKLKKVGLFI